MEKIRFQLADGTVEEFFIEEQTRIGGVSGIFLYQILWKMKHLPIF